MTPTIPHSVRSVADLAPGDHLCCIYRSEDEYRTATAEFLLKGLEQGEKAVCAAGAKAVDAALEQLRTMGVDVRDRMDRGQLVALVRDEIRTGEGPFEPEKAIVSLRDETERAVAEGYPALRVASEMTWACSREVPPGRTLEYEAKLNDFFGGSRCLAICQYDVRRCDPDVLVHILYAHPVAAIGAKVYDNFYYIPPAEFLGERSATIALEKILENLVEHNEAEWALWQRHEHLEALVAERAAELTRANEQLRAEIEERTRAAQALKAERDFTTAVLDTTGALVVVLDREGRFVRFNHTCEQVAGYSFDEVKGRPIWDLLLAPEEQAEVKAVFHRLRSGSFPNRHENYWVTRTGRRRLIAWSNTAIVDDRGEVEYVISTGLDITEQRRAEEALRQSEERYRQLVELSPDAIVVHREGKVEFVNSAAVRLLGAAKPEDLIGRPILDIVHPDYRQVVRERAARLSEGEKVPLIEEKFLRLDGTTVDVEVAAMPFLYLGKQAAQVIVRDITERKRAGQALRESEDRLRQAQKMEAIGRMAGGIAHDFNNQLTVVTGYCELLLRDMRSDDPLRPAVEEILRAAKRSGTLTSRLLTFSRKQIMHPQVINLNTVIGDLRDLFARMMGEDVELRTRFAGDLGNVRADLGLFEQALLNLVVNARDAMPGGGVLTIETSNVRLDESYVKEHADVVPGPYVMIAVSDTGVGMDRETLRQIFDPFFTTKPVGKGTGLGLPMVYGFVKQSGGHTVVYSEIGKGTTVRIYLPRVDLPAETREVVAAAPQRKLGTETILLVEDDEAVRALVMRVLRAGGYTVLPAPSPREAVTLAQAKGAAFDLLITDIVMPEMSGVDLARKLHESRPGLKVLFISGYTESVITERGLAGEGITLLTKPFSPTTLAETVRRVLDSDARKP